MNIVNWLNNVNEGRKGKEREGEREKGRKKEGKKEKKDITRKQEGKMCK